MMPKLKKSMALLPLIAFGAGLIACTPKPPEQVVKERAEQRYKHLMNGEMEKAYSYLTPSRRNTLSLENYLRNNTPRIDIKRAEVLKVECGTAESCQVEIKLDYTYKNNFKGTVPGMIDQVKPEKWILENGNWYLHTRR